PSELSRRNVQRRPEFKVTGRVLELGTHDSYNLIRRAVEEDIATYNRRIASEAALPKPVAQYGDARGLRRVELLLLCVHAAQEGSCVQRRKKAGRCPRALEPLGFPGARQVVVGHRTRQSDILKHLLSFAPVEIVCRAGVRTLKTRVPWRRPQGYQAVRLVVGK